MHTTVLRGIVSGLALLALGCSSPEPEPTGDKLFPPQAAQWNDYQGQSVDLRDYEGKVVLVNFWATWCGPCRYEIPALVEMSNEYDPEQVAIIGISIDQGPAERVLPLIGEFVEAFGHQLPGGSRRPTRAAPRLLQREFKADGRTDDLYFRSRRPRVQDALRRAARPERPAQSPRGIWRGYRGAVGSLLARWPSKRRDGSAVGPSLLCMYM